MKNDVNSKNSQLILGILAMALGCLFLLDNLGFVQIGSVIGLWPLAMIAIGAAKLADTRSPNGVLVGAVLVAVGTLMTLGRLGVIYFTWRAWWPVLLIVVGVAVMYQALTGKRLLAPVVKDGENSDGVVDITAILGGVERRVTSDNFRGGEMNAVMGGCVLDLRSASIQGEAVVRVFALFGGITIKCPPDWTVVVHGTPIMGGFEEKTAVPPDTSKRLIVQGYAIMGGVELRN